jgi:hypothetical protein
MNTKIHFGPSKIVAISTAHETSDIRRDGDGSIVGACRVGITSKQRLC